MPAADRAVEGQAERKVEWVAEGQKKWYISLLGEVDSDIRNG